MQDDLNLKIRFIILKNFRIIRKCLQKVGKKGRAEPFFQILVLKYPFFKDFSQKV